MSAGFLIFVLCAAFANGDIVTRKLCRGADPLVCRIHSVQVDPCHYGPAFCMINTNKSYGVTLDIIPQFAADKLKLAVYADVDNDGTFSSLIQAPVNACELTTCPVRPEDRKTINFNLKMNKMGSGKFPVKVVVWDKENETLSCCTTFNVKVK
ncbi:hypothetical protein K1T71_008106 [Dendrolimus kikuchii]|uniref:Uncharacterized protein n=1 Tax=Dendrolimus kikuchii TaxID=765133 RepID=A0ACC1CXD0_9NEOP|nr:hypothetical protein K1T71_008106 [Dendrolimus kikuchii]